MQEQTAANGSPAAYPFEWEKIKDFSKFQVVLAVGRKVAATAAAAAHSQAATCWCETLTHLPPS